MGDWPDVPIVPSDLDVPYLVSMIQRENERSVRVAARLGMSELREDVLLDVPVVVFWLSREEWSKSAQGAGG